VVFVTKGLEVAPEMVELARSQGIPLLRSTLKTAEFYRAIKPVVEEATAPRTTLHGSLADVYGVGLLFLGRSGIGKSECVLDLVERGHRLVADDVVQVTRRGNMLLGQGHELAAHHMEIRGVGLIDIPALFGVRSVRQQKRIEVVVHLEDWNNVKDADRTGLAQQETTILGVGLPKVMVALNPGKNITVISEVVAMNHLLRMTGIDTAAAFNERLIRRMRDKKGLREYLQEDFE
jgi:HPr kinase/phosphorylase